LERVAAFAQVNNLSWFEPILQNKEKTRVRVHSVVTSTTEGEGVDVFTPFSLFVCLFVCFSVYRRSQKVVDGSG